MKSNSTLKPLGALMAGLAFFSNAAVAQENTKPNTLTESQALPTVEVEAGREPSAYRATETRVGKVKQDPHDIPQALTSITKSLLEEQQTGSLREAMRNVSGLSFNAAEGGRGGDNMNLRGFYTFGDMYLDGIRDTAQYNREVFNLEQIDVLRGAGAMLFGRGQAGGVINQVTKTPFSYDQYKLTGSAGNYNYNQVTADLNKALNPDTALRINLMNRNEGSWRSNPTTNTEPEIHRKGIGLSLALNQQSNNRFWINQYYLKTKDNPDYGTSFDSASRLPSTRLPANYFYGIGRTFDNSETSMTSVVNELQITPDTQLRTQLRYADYQRSYWAIAPSLTAPTATGSTGGSNKTRGTGYQTVTLQSDLSTKFNAYGMKHEVITGVEYLKEESKRNALRDFGSAGAPDYRPYELATTGLSSFKSNSYAVYVQDTIEFMPKWKATLGARHDIMDANYLTTSSSRLKYGENSLRAALSFHPAADTHYYLAWSDSFSPTADLYQLSTSKPAERSDIVELGAKWLLLEGDLSLRAALYKAVKYWERNADLEATTAPILSKKRRTDGIELEAAGRITDNWEIFAGMALMDATILEVADGASQSYVGQRARNTPRYTFNLWSTYKIDANWKVGGGVETKGNRLAFNPASATVPTLNGVYHPNTAPSYARWDAMVSYEQKKVTYRLNIKNIFDKLYYDGIYDNGGFALPGTRRAVILTGEYKF